MATKIKAKKPALPSESEMIEALGGDLSVCAQRCHAAALGLVKSGVFKTFARVARGWCMGVPGQHSWVVVGEDCYAPGAIVVDPTRWSYDSSVEGIWMGKAKEGGYSPHGAGSIWEWGRPPYPTGPVVELTPSEPLTLRADSFLEMLGPLDEQGWNVLAHAPVQGWPAGEIYAAMLDTPGLGHWIPIDRIGMLTKRNPNGLYLKSED